MTHSLERENQGHGQQMNEQASKRTYEVNPWTIRGGHFVGSFPEGDGLPSVRADGHDIALRVYDGDDAFVVA